MWSILLVFCSSAADVIGEKAFCVICPSTLSIFQHYYSLNGNAPKISQDINIKYYSGIFILYSAVLEIELVFLLKDISKKEKSWFLHFIFVFGTLNILYKSRRSLLLSPSQLWYDISQILIKSVCIWSWK